jgi:hypothetical protein
MPILYAFLLEKQEMEKQDNVRDMPYSVHADQGMM